MSKAVIALDEGELAMLQMILTDNDDKEALRFLRDVIWAKAELARRQGMRSHLDKGQT